MKEKIYKRKIYWVATTKFCGCIAVDQDGMIYGYDTAPYFKKMHGKSYRKLVDYLKRTNQFISSKRIGTEIDPF